MRLHRGTPKPFEKITGISANQISAYLRGDKGMSKSRSFVLEKASKKLGHRFSASDWMFNPEKIKAELAKSAEAA